jgi:Putative MetA-pathway of phenol degradation/Putative beta-barrel porin 2
VTLLSFRDFFIRHLAEHQPIRQLGMLVLLLLIAPLSAVADEFKLTPSIAVREDYNDNIFFVTQGEQRDFITVAAPALTLSNRSETTDLNLRAALAAYNYARYSSLNTVDPTLQGSIQRRLTPRLAMSANAGYLRNSNPDQYLEETGLLLNSVTRERFQGGFSSEYILSEKTTTALSYNFGRERYDSNTYADLESHSIQLSAIHDLDARFSRTKGRMNLGYDNYRYSTGALVNNYSATVGFIRNITETVSLLLDAGGRYTVTDFDQYRNVAPPPFPPVLVKEEETSSGWGWVGQATLAYKGEKGTANLSFGNNVFPSSGRTESTERMSLAADMRYRLTYEWSVAVNGAYYRNKSDQGQFSTVEINEHTWLISPSMRYEFTKDLYLDASYSFNRVDYRQSDTDAARNIVMLKLTWQYPWEK